MGLIRRLNSLAFYPLFLVSIAGTCPSLAWETLIPSHPGPAFSGTYDPPVAVGCADLPLATVCEPVNDYLVKLAYGRTFGTSTALDYATLEFSKRVSRYPALTVWGPATGEVQLALLASYVFYSEGQIERVKKLNFHDGYEFGWVPKGRFTFPSAPCIGFSPYLESGAGLSYVSETFRNSGSRWNWSLMGGLGLEKCLPGEAVFSLGVQWRHLSNGNMWGKGDELHNSNSGTDMIQGIASVLHRF